MNIGPNPNHDPLNLSRRSFIKTTGLTVGAIGAGGIIPSLAAEKAKSTSDTLVKNLYDSLNEQQRKSICFDYDNKLRLEVDNNWNITKTR